MCRLSAGLATSFCESHWHSLSVYHGLTNSSTSKKKNNPSIAVVAEASHIFRRLLQGPLWNSTFACSLLLPHVQQKTWLVLARLKFPIARMVRTSCPQQFLVGHDVVKVLLGSLPGLPRYAKAKEGLCTGRWCHRWCRWIGVWGASKRSLEWWFVEVFKQTGEEPNRTRTGTRTRTTTTTTFFWMATTFACDWFLYNPPIHRPKAKG